jgi:hypothetical protein
VRRALLGLACLAVLGGCGGGDDDKAKTPKDAVLRYYDALGKSDVEKACSFTTGPAAATCERDAKALLTPGGDPKLLAENAHTVFEKQTFVVRGDLACASLQQFSFDTKKVGDEWKVLRLKRPLTDRRDCTVGLHG